ncbi:hypothetical protein HRI_003934700 [Hibiscus trionum]|uniref:RRM domain-containing protein n=1 Tax=Hibiscus trionum TaxID=183268 RepID=A0A9W7IVA7_HIBTR|nr:hypothetical protein HRI_003934700 [Hibiscus trionum]
MSGRSERSERTADCTMVRRRLGVSIFVDNVSRRIHLKTLKEAFQEYGTVVDVYMAYGNQKRRNKPIVFAFVRFSNKEEAKSAIQKGNGRIMDGFKVRIFMAVQKLSEKTRVRNHVYETPRWAAAFRDTRLFKEVVMGVPEPNKPSRKNIAVERGDGAKHKEEEADNSRVESTDKVVRVVMVETNHEARKLEEVQSCIPIQKEEIVWLKNCMVGKIKPMYNIEIVQEALMELMP